jgi:DNA polymerase III subunit delta
VPGKRSSKARAAGPADRVVVFKGKDEYLRALHTEKLVEQIRDERGDAETIRFDGAAEEPASVLDECRSLDLMMRHKVVIVDDAEKLVRESARPLFERYAENPPESATLVLRSGAWRAGKLDKLVQKVGSIVSCDALRPDQAAAWAVQRAKKRHNAELDRDAAALLVDRLGTDLGRIDSETGKLAAAAEADGSSAITADHVRELVGRTREEEAWAVQSRLLAGPEEALAAVREALGPWRQPPVMVMFACVDLARKLHGASRLLAQGVPPQGVAKELKLWGASRDLVLSAARSVPPTAAARTLRTLIGLDRDAKSGVIGPELAPELAAIEFARLTAR